MSEFIRLQANGVDAYPDSSTENTYRSNGTSVESALLALESNVNTLGGVAGEAKTLAEQNSVKIATAEQEISDINSILENMFPSFDIPIAGTKITNYYTIINTDIDKTKYKPISLQYNGDSWTDKCFFTINIGNDINNVSISVGCVVENYTIPSNYAPLKMVCVNINN